MRIRCWTDFSNPLFILLHRLIDPTIISSDTSKPITLNTELVFGNFRLKHDFMNL